jgi:hypothetical protein
MAKRHGKHRKYSGKGFPQSSRRVTQVERRTTMTIKQKLILGGLVLTVISIDVIVALFSRHPHDVFSSWYMMMVTGFGSYTVGKLEHKWKRDKEMSHIVADRLLGKNVASDPSQSMNAGMGQQAMNQQSKMNGSLLGGGGALSSQGANSLANLSPITQGASSSLPSKLK